ncbi:high-affinity Zn(2+) transporter zrt1 [Knufia peltigerae]|uniref:High-affinity Zn(2+) transporter zrt1 n=1 Tax=Knufia peltigerae TaxID=1002370 RepID=A0AA39CZV4_9EURO|nr:high-affinity Zn(2+) transporter zrt1 [Knufia peltigerae]
MLSISFLVLAGVSSAIGQVTYTGCHNHSTVEYCYGPDGEETALATYTSVPTMTTFSTSTLPASVSASASATTSSGQTTAVTGCHTHETNTFCINGIGNEVQISGTATATGAPPAQYTDCHSHGNDQYCMGPGGEEVQVMSEGAHSESGHDEADGDKSEMDCHFHAGVEHCVPKGGSESSSSSASSASCELQERDYNIGLRVGTLFVVLATSAIGVFAPIFMARLPFQNINSILFTTVKQFGTGVIVSTAFVHLYTHASLMFNNQCLGALDYEATTSAIVMAGIFISFLFEYLGHRIILARKTRKYTDTSANATTTNLPTKEDDSTPTSATSVHAVNSVTGPEASRSLASLGHSHGSAVVDPTNPNSKLSVSIMEAGILFHSILIGLTLVVAGDSFYKTLLVVIVFHQFFEGLALGARIALLPKKGTGSSFWRTKFPMATAFALITPLGMAIGLGVIHSFNGNDRDTILTIGTLDALSAGILVWVGIVDMWARDWIVEGGEMTARNLGYGKIGLGLLSLVAGFIGMSVLGKWA